MSIGISVVQLKPRRGLSLNMPLIISAIEQAKLSEADVVVFPEAATTGYFHSVISNTKNNAIEAACSEICRVCKENHVAAIVGTPWPSGDDESRWNAALVIDKKGNIVCIQKKLQLVPTDSWAIPGKDIYAFELDGILCSASICHDIRHPELTRLPVLAGSRVHFYLSCETFHDDGPVPQGRQQQVYCAQVQARAVENRIYIVHANATGGSENGGSHGSSKIVGPTGLVLVEASIREEESIFYKIELDQSASLANVEFDANACYAMECLNPNVWSPLRNFWENGVRDLVTVVTSEGKKAVWQNDDDGAKEAKNLVFLQSKVGDGKSFYCVISNLKKCYRNRNYILKVLRSLCFILQEDVVLKEPNQSYHIITKFDIAVEKPKCFYVSFLNESSAEHFRKEFHGRILKCFGSRAVYISPAKLVTMNEKAVINSMIECTSVTASVHVPGLLYTPNVVSVEEEEQLLTALDNCPWETRMKRRVQHYGYRFDYDSRLIDKRPREVTGVPALPDWVSPILPRIAALSPNGCFPDQLTINEYLPGQGIRSHVDSMDCFEDGIASLSLGSDCVMQMKLSTTSAKGDEVVQRREQPHRRRAVVLFTGDARHLWAHGIAPRKCDVFDGVWKARGRRVSLTFRKVKFDK
eukprot:g3754.t1